MMLRLRVGSILLITTVTGCGGSATTTPDAGPVDAAHADSGTDLGSPDLGSPDFGGTCPDTDSDGHTAAVCGSDDCNDADPSSYPGNTELCDASGHDEDCDPATFGMLDVDHDGYVSFACCNVTATGMNCGDDCSDTDMRTHPSAVESCDGLDNDCNGLIDDGVPTHDYFPDCDMDGHGAMASTPTNACMVPTDAPPCASGGGWAMAADDCLDTNVAVFPGATEVCDGLDTNCDGTTEPDADGDGHYAIASCTATPGGMPDDCRDDLVDVHPGVTTFGTGACPVGQHVCGGLHGLAVWGSFCFAAATPCPAAYCPSGPCPPSAFFDYDCNGTVEPQPSSTRACAGSSSISTFGCNTGDGIHYTGTAPACGSPVNDIDCHATGTSVPYPCSVASMTSVPFPCR